MAGVSQAAAGVPLEWNQGDDVQLSFTVTDGAADYSGTYALSIAPSPYLATVDSAGATMTATASGADAVVVFNWSAAPLAAGRWVYAARKDGVTRFTGPITVLPRAGQ